MTYHVAMNSLASWHRTEQWRRSTPEPRGNLRKHLSHLCQCFQRYTSRLNRAIAGPLRDQSLRAA